MNKRYRFILALFLFVSLGSVAFLTLHRPTSSGVLSYEREEEELEMSKEDASEELARREFEMTVDPTLGEIPKWRLLDVMKLMGNLKKKKTVQTRNAINGITWEERGPNNVGGRTRAIVVDVSDATGNTVLSGSVGGGIWRTTDALAAQPNWTAVDDFLDNLAVGCMAQDTFDTNVFYAGTGEGWFNGDAIRGLGIWKSTDGGMTFNQLASTNNSTFHYNQKIVVPAQNVLLVATRNGGVQRSTDGGGIFNKVLGTGAGAVTDRAADLEIAANGDIYASMGIFNSDGIYKSTDQGVTWNKLTGGGIASGRRIELACAPSNAQRVLAIFHSTGNNDVSDIQLSDDGGTSWTSKPVPGAFGMANYTRGQAWYDLISAFDPDDDTRIFIGGVDVLLSEDSGGSWNQITQWYGGGGFQYMHADQHAMTFDPNNTTHLFFGNDGGIYRTTDANAATPNVTGIYNDYNVTQFYACDINPTMSSNNFLAGAQDNGTHKFTTPGMNTTTEVTGGDGAYCHIDQDNENIQISSYVYNNYRVTTNNWTTVTYRNHSNTGRFINPTDYDSDADILYAAYLSGQFLRMSDVGGTNTFSTFAIAAFPSQTVSAVTASPNVSNRVYFGFPGGDIVRVNNANGGAPAGTLLTRPTGAYLNCIEIENGDENHILVAYSNYGVNSVWESTDGGTSWTSIEGNLPDMPIRWIKFYPGQNDQAMVATEMGVWTTDNLNGGATVWGPSNTNFANVRVDMLAVRENDKTVIAATHGRGLFSFQVQSCNITASGLSNVQCNDNGTPCDPSDDYITFDLNVQGTATGATYSVSAAGHVVTDLTAPNNYNTVESFRLENGSAGGGNVMITITDDTDNTCTLDDTVTDLGTCSTQTNAAARINEFHYDNTGADVNQFVEVYIPDPQPTDLNNYTIELYNGSNGSSYGVKNLNDPAITVTAGVGGSFYVWDVTLQNGAPDGLALAGPCGLIEFLSYEGTFTANSGIANGVLSTDVGVSETSSTPVNSAIQLIAGVWTYTPSCNTKGSANNTCTCSIDNSGLNNIQCNDNGTPTDATDDYITFDLNVTGSNLGSTYTVSAAGHTVTDLSAPNNYNTVESFRLENGTAGGGNVTITITDDTDNSCTLNDMVTDPGSCATVTLDIKIKDPCQCKDNATTLNNGQFDETVTVTAPSGQTWNMIVATEFYDPSSPAPPAAPTPYAVPAAMSETPIGGGLSEYEIPGIILDGITWSISCSNGTDTLSISNQCYYPNPSITGVMDTLCMSDATFAPGLSYDRGDGNPPGVPADAETFKIDGIVINPPMVNPGSLSPGTHYLAYEVDAGNEGTVPPPGPGFPGCVQEVYDTVFIQAPPTIICPPDSVNMTDCNIDVPAAQTMFNTDTSGAGFINPAWPTILNGCGTVSLSSFNDTMDNGCTRIITIHYIATDGSNNADTCGQMFMFHFDTVPPTFSLTPVDITVDCSAPTADTVETIDNCGCGMTAPSEDVWINEFHYDNSGTDVGEFIEVAGTAGTDLSTYSIVLYNGSNGNQYNTKILTGTIDNEGNGFGAVDFQYPTNGIQNGSPDGIALVKSGTVLQFWSYEGTFTANNGPAAGMTSVDVGVSESSGTPVGNSLQLIGMGSTASDFMWSGPSGDSPGDLNAMQVLMSAGGSNPFTCSIDLNEVKTPGNCPNEYTVTRTWTATDGCGNTATQQQVVTVIDDTPPEFCAPGGLPQDTTISCSAALPDASIVSGIDACDTSLNNSIWINEFHYDNAGADQGEFVEVAGYAGIDLSAYSIVLYNGANGLTYKTTNLTGTFTAEQCGFGALSFDISGIQNGSPDGIALVKGNTVIEFISYEGAFTANNGPAAGMTSVDIGVSEPSNTPVGMSLQRTGSGNSSMGFSWTGPLAQSRNTLNAGQVIQGPIVADFTETVVAGSCIGEQTITRTWMVTDQCDNTATHQQIIQVVDTTAPAALCRNTTIYVDAYGNATLTTGMVDNGSMDNCSPVTLALDKTSFNCSNIGVNQVTLTVTDDCGNSSTCASFVEVKDTIAPVLNCLDIELEALPGFCYTRLPNILISVFSHDNCDPAPAIEQVDDGAPKSGEELPIGDNLISVKSTDKYGNTSYCTFNIHVKGYHDPYKTLTCQDMTQLSLDPNCTVTLTADMFLIGAKYHCYADYLVEVRNEANTGDPIDDDTKLPGVQLDRSRAGKCFTVTVIDPDNFNNKCWGKLCVEDKIPPRIDACPNDTITCLNNPLPLSEGGDVIEPVVFEGCGLKSITYVDWVDDGNCNLGYESKILRTWTFEDNSGNKASCSQLIIVEYAGLFDIDPPHDYDGLDRDMLMCDAAYNEAVDTKIDASQRGNPHFPGYPYCVDGYLLDTAVFNASGVRQPRPLGWNRIRSGVNAGHPSPYTVYYKNHWNWVLSKGTACWGPNTYAKWIGTGTPSGASCSNINMTFEDKVFDTATEGCDAGEIGCYKIARKWTVLDWCTSEIGGWTQIIKVADTEGPKVTYPDALTIGMRASSCSGYWVVEAPWLEDNCSNEIHYTVEVKTGIVQGDETRGFIVFGLAEGMHLARIIAWDCCGNKTVHEVKLTIVDNIPPTPVCQAHTVVGLTATNDGASAFVTVCAESFDQGSYDNCKDQVWFKVIRMEELLGKPHGSTSDNRVACNGINGDDDFNPRTGNQVFFDDCTSFCCQDLGQTVMVVFRVFDINPGPGPVNPKLMERGYLKGHFSDCMVEVEVQNKSLPLVQAPDDVVVSCQFWFDDSEDALSDPNNPTFGRVVTDVNLRKKLKTTDIVCPRWCEDIDLHFLKWFPHGKAPQTIPIPAVSEKACFYANKYYNPTHPENKYALVWGWDGFVSRTCGITPTIDVNDSRECGQGLITRTVTVTIDGVRYQDKQQIWVVNCDPFYIDPEVCTSNTDDIEWPNGCNETINLEGCGADLDPDNPALGKPKIVGDADNQCALIAIDYTDRIITIEKDACFKVIRDWSVVDWCQYDPDVVPETGSQTGYYTHPHPGEWHFRQIILVKDQIDPEVSCSAGDCEPNTYRDTVIDGVRYCIGHIDLTVSATDECTQDDWLTFDYKIDLYNDRAGKYGTYDVYVGKARPGEDAVDYYNPWADNELDPSSASGTYPVGTHMLQYYVEDGCGNVGLCNLLFEVKDCKQPTPYCEDGIVTVLMPSNGQIEVWASDFNLGSFDNCTKKKDLIFSFSSDTSQKSRIFTCDDLGSTSVQMWVTDEAGNQDYCEVFIDLQDNNDVCGGTTNVRIGGNILGSNTAAPIPDAEVSIYNPNGFVVMHPTAANGSFLFDGMTKAVDYTIKPVKDDDPLNGVNTRDLVAIQQHLLGKKTFTSPYQYIAADINNNRKVSTADVVALRKIVLGKVAGFGAFDNTSWRFVDKNFRFADPYYPWPFDETISYPALKSSKMHTDFTGVKIGDLTADAGLKNSGTRDRGPSLPLNTTVENLESGDLYEMVLHTVGNNDISGLQMTIAFNPEYLRFADISSGQLKIDASNLGVKYLSKGVLMISWSDVQLAHLSEKESLLTVRFKVLKACSNADVIHLDNTYLHAEAYDDRLAVRDISLSFDQTAVRLMQNRPNPFRHETTIGFVLPEDMPVQLSIYGLDGKLIFIKDIQGLEGYNSYTVKKEILPVDGVLYYELSGEDFTKTRRMIFIR